MPMIMHYAATVYEMESSTSFCGVPDSGHGG